jgi:hypothetical protein
MSAKQCGLFGILMRLASLSVVGPLHSPIRLAETMAWHGGSAPGGHVLGHRQLRAHEIAFPTSYQQARASCILTLAADPTVATMISADQSTVVVMKSCR